jgi:hypothetical protein
MCVDDTPKKVQYLTERGVLSGDEPIVRDPENYHVVTLLILLTTKMVGECAWIIFTNLPRRPVAKSSSSAVVFA